MIAAEAQGQAFIALSPNGDSLFAKCSICPEQNEQYKAPKREPAIIHNVKPNNETNRDSNPGRPLPKADTIPAIAPGKKSIRQTTQYWGAD